MNGLPRKVDTLWKSLLIVLDWAHWIGLVVGKSYNYKSLFLLHMVWKCLGYPALPSAVWHSDYTPYTLADTPSSLEDIGCFIQQIFGGWWLLATSCSPTSYSTHIFFHLFLLTHQIQELGSEAKCESQVRFFLWEELDLSRVCLSYTRHWGCHRLEQSSWEGTFVLFSTGLQISMLIHLLKFVKRGTSTCSKFLP